MSWALVFRETVGVAGVLLLESSSSSAWFNSSPGDGSACSGRVTRNNEIRINADAAYSPGEPASRRVDLPEQLRPSVYCVDKVALRTVGHSLPGWSRDSVNLKVRYTTNFLPLARIRYSRKYEFS